MWGFIGDIDWGTAPDWLSGVGTVGTLAVAVGVLARESTDRRRRDEYARSAQARQVHLGPVTPGGASGRQGSYMDMTYSIAVTNSSDDAIHNVGLSLGVHPESVQIGTSRMLGTSSLRVKKEVLAAGEVLPLTGTVRINWDQKAAEVASHEMRPFLMFDDMAHQKWVRTHDYRLRPV